MHPMSFIRPQFSTRVEHSRQKAKFKSILVYKIMRD